MPTTFMDSKSRTWNISINLGVCKKIKTQLDLDFLSADESSNPLLKLASDYLLLADVLWILVEPQAIAQNVTVDDFIESLSGDSIDAAVNALAEAYCFFVPNPKRREILQRLWVKVRDAESKILAEAEKQVEAVTFPTPGP